eukprot:scaffold56111_cov58-Phaeocystis_antarctica.AAC.1
MRLGVAACFAYSSSGFRTVVCRCSRAWLFRLCSAPRLTTPMYIPTADKCWESPARPGFWLKHLRRRGQYSLPLSVNKPGPSGRHVEDERGKFGGGKA